MKNIAMVKGYTGTAHTHTRRVPTTDKKRARVCLGTGAVKLGRLRRKALRTAMAESAKA